MRTGWRARAACASKPTHWWFEQPGTEEFEQAAAVCGRCPVIEECGLAGFQSSEWGLWGTYLKADGPKYRRKRVLVRCERCGTPVLGEAGKLRRCSGCVRPPARLRLQGVRRFAVEGIDDDDAVAALDAFLHDSGRRTA